MTIRTAEENDLKAIIDIYNQAIDEEFCTADLEYLIPEERLDWFRSHTPEKYPIFVSEENGTVSGWCSLSAHRPGRGALETVAEISYYVHRNFRKKGIGKQLITHTIDEARRLGYQHLFALLLDMNKASVRILEKFGFEKWGHLPGIANVRGTICGQFIYGKKIG